jgi:hypothetical protein
MDYSELLKEYGFWEHIPYEQLLNTSDWQKFRSEIIKRDNFCCTNCGKTESNSFLNLNISFQTKDRLLDHKTVYSNDSVDFIKNELDIKAISVNKIKNHENRVYGISEKGHLFVVGFSDIQNVSKEDLVINHGITEFGNQYYIIYRKGIESIESQFLIPIITENPVKLHVHHKYYIINTLPWSYEQDGMITLCNLCHWELHQQTEVPIYARINGELRKMNYTPCFRCSGAGVLPHYKHVEHGICFRCRGRRYEELIPNQKII